MDTKLDISYKRLRVKSEAQAEFDEKRSRFIAVLLPFESETEQQDVLSHVRSLYPAARHYVYAWVLADGTERASDDGEPSHSAGLPVLERLQAAQLKDVICVVVRYFGGVLLGTGGLKRAYAEAAKLVVQEAEQKGCIQAICELTPVQIELGYAQLDTVLHMAKTQGAIKLSVQYRDIVELELGFNDDRYELFIEQYRNYSAGKARWRIKERSFYPCDVLEGEQHD